MDQPAYRGALAVPSRAFPNLAPAGAGPAPAAALVIFGAHGDLTKRLLMPSLYNLAAAGLLDDGFRVIGVDRAESDDAHWREELTATMQEFTKDPSAEFYVESIDEKAWGWVTQRLAYQRADFTKDAEIDALARRVQGSAIFYLAVASRFFGDVVEQLGRAGLLREETGTFRRVVIEKPFGTDLASARELNRRVLAQAAESQVFRIDHFLGKETVQNILAFRFANGIFEPLWRREYIEAVEIIADETIGVEGRGSFYEPTGALRDMVPNHLFQLLCMVAMEPPSSLAAEALRDEKAKLVHAVEPVAHADVVRGQYTAGTVQGHAVPGYREEPNVAPDSTTETFVSLRLHIDNWRWGGVPFSLRTGKRLGHRCTEVRVHFRKPPFALFRDAEVSAMTANVLVINIQPEEGLTLSLSAKRPGPTMRLAGVDLHFRYADAFEERPNVGYETLIYDCLIGDPALFQRADMIEAAWAVVEPAIREGGEAPVPYAAGSDGPEVPWAVTPAAPGT